jgi:hypothetical protein
MNELFRHYTAEHQLIEEDEVYTYQPSNKEMYYALENLYGCNNRSKSDFVVLLT